MGALITRYANTGNVVKSLQRIENRALIAAIATQMAEQEQRQKQFELGLKQVQSEVAAINQRAIDAEKSLKALPPATKPVPAASDRANLNKLIRDYCYITRIRHENVWRELYREFRYRYHIDLPARATNANMSALDMAESLGVIDDLYSLACDMFGSVK